MLVIGLWVSPLTQAANFQITAPSGLNFWDDNDDLIKAYPLNTKLQATGIRSGKWGEFLLPNHKKGWGYMGYLKPVHSLAPNDDTEASFCPTGHCPVKAPLQLHHTIAQVAVATHAPQRLPARGRTVRPIEAAPNARRGFRMVQDPWDGHWYMHKGQDYPAPYGTRVSAVKDGVIVAMTTTCGDKPSVAGRRCGQGFGNTVTIRHADGKTSMYAHLESSGHCAITRTLHVGESVSAGDSVGCVGASGRATGAHLLFVVRNSSGTAIDPLQYIR